MYAITKSVWWILQRISGSLKFFLIRVMCGRGPNMNQPDSYFCLVRELAKCIMRVDEFNLHVDDVIMERTFMQKNINLTCLWFELDLIKRCPWWKNFIAKMFYGKERIRKRYLRWKFYGEEQKRKRSQKYQCK